METLKYEFLLHRTYLRGINQLFVLVPHHVSLRSPYESTILLALNEELVLKLQVQRHEGAHLLLVPVNAEGLELGYVSRQALHLGPNEFELVVQPSLEELGVGIY